MYAQTIDWLRTQRTDIERELDFLFAGRLDYRMDGSDVSPLIAAGDLPVPVSPSVMGPR
jgi:hypothetical protein